MFYFPILRCILCQVPVKSSKAGFTVFILYKMHWKLHTKRKKIQINLILTKYVMFLKINKCFYTY